MRNTFARLMTDYAASREELVLLYADIGNRLFNPLKDIAGPRTINAGIAESNMISMAAGMAKEGLRPVCYTITPFTTSRNYEQIKIDVAYQNLPVIIVGTGSGMSYANLGPTHHSFEDIAIMRALPNMQIVCPADSKELAALFPQVLAHDGPTYVRIGKKNEPDCYPHLVAGELPTIQVGKAAVLSEFAQSPTPSPKIAIVANGTILPLAQQLHATLADQGANVHLASIATVKPLDTQYLQKISASADVVIAIEEHGLAGGFTGALAEWWVDQPETPHAKLLRFGLPDQFIDRVHSRDDALAAAKLALEPICEALCNRGILATRC